MELMSRVADLNHLTQVVSHYQQRHRNHPRRKELRPGCDGETLTEFVQHLDSNLRSISGSLMHGEYSFSPFLERKITIPGGRTKTICQATMRDTIVQKATALVVEPEFDLHLAGNCCSFRQGKDAPSINEAISFVVHHHRSDRYWVIKEDISSYYDHLDHDLLLAYLRELLPHESPVLSLYFSYLKAPRLIGEELLSRKKGVPVGTILANSLSNLYLTPLDRLMEEEGRRYLRYCDDIIVFCEDREEAYQVKSMIADTAAGLGLTLNPRKSLLARPGAPFVHLGYEFDGQTIRIGQPALRKFKMRIRKVTPRKAGKGLTRHDLQTDRGLVVLREMIARVNEEIGGDALRNWARYFARCDFDDQFRELDHWIRNRVRAAVTKSWNKGNYRLVPTPLLQERGLKSLVGEYHRWKNHWQDRDKELINAIASLDHLRDVLNYYRARYYNRRNSRYDFKAGADGVTMEQFLSAETSNLGRIQDQLLRGEYRFTPFVEYARPKRGRTDERVICRASLADTVVQKATSTVVDRRFDHILSERCYSYRRGKSQYSAFGRVLAYIRAKEDWWVLRYDFRTFLDTVDLTILSSQLQDLLAEEPLLLDLYLNYLYDARMRDGKLLPRTVGLPRGGILTPFLANLYLTPVDEMMVQEGYEYVRYADDVIIFAEEEDRARKAQELIRGMAAQLSLSFSPAKSLLVKPGGEFEYLGYLIRGREVRVRPYAMNSLKRRIKRVTARRKYPHLTTKMLGTEGGRETLRTIITRVNRTYIYKGGSDWTRHFCRCTNDDQFRALDRWIADRIRACFTKKWAPKNRRVVPYQLLRELGWKPLAPLFYRWRREVWRQGTGSS